MDAMVEGAPKITEDTMPGELANVVSGRVANLLDLQGPTMPWTPHVRPRLRPCSTPAVCCTRQVDAMICGASDRTMDPATYAKFSAIGALSSSHSTPFDARANGFVMGEGAGAMVLKRLGDAVRTATKSSRSSVALAVHPMAGQGHHCPSQRGQIQAIARAYNQAGYAPSSVELVEAHGTSTKVGDATELSTLGTLWTDIEAGDNVAVGSIKSQIGHLKAAAGMAGLLKVTMALHHATIPRVRVLNTEPNGGLVDQSSLPTAHGLASTCGPSAPCWRQRLRFWRHQLPRRPRGLRPRGPRGHGRDVVVPLGRPSWARLRRSGDPSSTPTATPSLDHAALKSVEGGVLLLSGDSVEAVAARLAALSVDGPTFDEDPRGHRLSAVFPTWSTGFDVNAAVRLAVVATSWAEFEKRKGLAASSCPIPPVGASLRPKA